MPDPPARPRGRRKAGEVPCGACREGHHALCYGDPESPFYFGHDGRSGKPRSCPCPDEALHAALTLDARHVALAQLEAEWRGRHVA